MPEIAVRQEDLERQERLANAPKMVSVSNLNKRFKIPDHRFMTLKERVIHPLKTQTYRQLEVLKDIDFSVAEGEFFGIIGRNGSGKSTLLKCLAGIYDTGQGSIAINGRLSPFIELGVGFNADLTARDNVIINAIMLGLSPKEARARFEQVIEFAELEGFLDVKLKNYSSGMVVRLAFSVAIQAEAEILLIDEVLAVGDAAFQQKCFEEFQKMKDEGKTILFVTHEMSLIERFCDRAMLLEKGDIVDIGKPNVIARKYNELNFGRGAFGESRVTPKDQSTSSDNATVKRSAEIYDAWIENRRGERVKSLSQGDICRLCMDIQFNETVEDPIFGFTLRNESRQTVFATNSAWAHHDTGTYHKGDKVTAVTRFESWLAPNRYSFTPSIAKKGTGTEIIDVQDNLASLMLHATKVSGGLVDLPHQFQFTKHED